MKGLDVVGGAVRSSSNCNHCDQYSVATPLQITQEMIARDPSSETPCDELGLGLESWLVLRLILGLELGLQLVFGVGVTIRGWDWSWG